MLNLARKIWKTNIKNQILLMLSVLAAVGVFQIGVKNSLPQILISVSTAVGLDYIIFYLRFKKIFFSTSALVTGLIIALTLTPGINWHIPVVGAVIAIGSKHIIRIKGKHIFNPANFGLLLSLFVFRSYLAWWGTSITWLVLILGMLITYRFKRFHLALSFLITQFILLGIYFALKKQPILNALLMTNLFFIFIMLVEPKTSPIRRNGRIFYGALTGVFSSLFILVLPKYDPSVLGLALSNLCVPFINKKFRG